MIKLFLTTMLAALVFAIPAFAERIVIVHGAFENAKAWNNVAALLKAKGYDVALVDLPSRDAKGDLKAVNLKAYVDATRAIVDAKADPVFLVGHSFGGFTISNTAEADAARVKKLIYLAAFVPKSGESMQKLSALDKNNKFTQLNFVVAPDYSYAEVLKMDRGLIFANDAPADVQAKVADSLLREPLGPIAEPVTLTTEFDGVAKAFIRTGKDNAVSPTMQDMMIERSGIKQVVKLDTGHSPFITAPQATADAIIQAIGE